MYILYLSRTNDFVAIFDLYVILDCFRNLPRCITLESQENPRKFHSLFSLSNEKVSQISKNLKLRKFRSFYEHDLKNYEICTYCRRVWDRPCLAEYVFFFYEFDYEFQLQLQYCNCNIFTTCICLIFLQCIFL
jgi:hypothetical protein